MLNKIFNENMYSILVVFLIVFSFFMVLNNVRKEGMENTEEKKVEKKEKRPMRQMYLSSGIRRNSSYDSRAEPVETVFEPEKTGAFYNSVLNNNYTNDLVMMQ